MITRFKPMLHYLTCINIDYLQDRNISYNILLTITTLASTVL